MNVIILLFLLIALVLFIIATFVPVARVNLIALGLACLTLGAWIIPAVTKLG